MKALQLVVTALFVASPAYAQTPNPLEGRWIVDLSVNPDEPYTKTMELYLEADGTVTGNFYDSEIQAGRWKLDRGRTCVSFRTTDGVGPYHTSGCLRGTTVEGQTWAEHRSFLFNWIATRAD
ncbi:hypothetical protein ACXYN8_02915 [Altererythrobacter sp. CAU 1778]